MKKAKKKAEFDLKDFIIKELRRAFKRSPQYSEALNRAKHHLPDGVYKNGKPKTLVHYQCAECKGFFRNKTKDDKVAVDHIKPLIDVENGFIDWNTYIPSLYCSLDNLQVLCNYPKRPDGNMSCHKIKTKLENQQRRKKN